eukprot:TRINITY_DN2416_c0_g1_i4.p1 TRINITY_DN2416_c0_g1~~TRINITY_DN2416_c0_g1_i4.p1  ORF type:complete len:526 (-),score=90.87 TRINITY_DN2416_c0_g1_i4:1051-2628(-)
MASEKSPLLGVVSHGGGGGVINDGGSGVMNINAPPPGTMGQDSGIYDSNTFPEKKEDGFGGKNISFFGSISLITNNMTGPTMITIPVVFQQAGWVPTIILTILMMIISNFSSTFLCEAMSSIPGNNRFQGRIELSTLAEAYFPKYLYKITMLLLFITLQGSNIAAIIVSAQTMDLTLLAIFKWTGALEFYPHFGFASATTVGDAISPFGNDVYVLSLGFIIVLLLTIPLGFLNLDDNATVQEAAMALTIAIIIEWASASFGEGLIQTSRVPAIGPNQGLLMGTLIFTFASVVNVPSWANEMKPKTNVNHCVWIGDGVATLLLLIPGLLGAWSYDFTGSQDLLDVIDADDGRFAIPSRITVYLFPAVVCLSGIPVTSIIVRYNLMLSGLCGKYTANFWAVVFPWLVSIPFYTGAGLSNVINWTSLLCNGITNFIIPLSLYILSIQAEARASLLQKGLDTKSVPLMKAARLLGKAYVYENRKHFYAAPWWKNHPRRSVLLCFVMIAVLVSLTILGIVSNIISTVQGS